MARSKTTQRAATAQPETASAKAAQSSRPSELEALQRRFARLTKERDEAVAAAARLQNDLDAAQNLLEEAATERPDTALEARLAELNTALAGVERDIRDAEQRHETARQITAGTEAAAQTARDQQQKVAAQLSEVERQLRELKHKHRIDKRLAEDLQAKMASLTADIRHLEAEAARYGNVEQVDCGCEIMVRKGADCVRGALLTVISPCHSTIGDNDLVVERHG